MKQKRGCKKRKYQRLHLLLSVSLGTFVLVLAVGYIGVAQYYKRHFFANTWIEGMDCSNLTAKQAEERLTAEIESYVLVIRTRDGSKEWIGSHDIGMAPMFQEDLTTMLHKQNAYVWFPKATKGKYIKEMVKVRYDEAKLQQKLKGLSCMATERQSMPTDAAISPYSRKTGFVVVKETEGTKIRYDVLRQKVKEAVSTLKGELALEEEDCYEKPKTVASDPRITAAMKQIDTYMRTKVSYQFGKEKVCLDGTWIGPAICVDKEYRVSIAEPKIKEFFDHIRKAYCDPSRPYQFMTSYGKMVTMKGAEYGWRMNTQTELKEALESIKKGEQKEKQLPVSSNMEQALAKELGNTYVEINLAKQQLFLYKEGKRVLESALVSGNERAGHATPEGIYFVRSLETNRYLRGLDDDGSQYSSYVNFWMPFNGGIGLHDASWRHGRFGGTIYKTRGSHGCINLPYDKAKQIFQVVSRGTPVVVYQMKEVK